MKTLANNKSNLLAELSRQERLSHNVSKALNALFSKPITTENQFLDRVTSYSFDENIGENITKQSILKGLFPRFSTKKNNMITAIKNNDAKFLSNKVEFINPEEKSDVRFFLESKTASKFANTSGSIKKISMNSENPTRAIINPSGNNKLSDTNITINDRTFLMDIKSGDNMSNISGSCLAEIPYCENGELHTIINKGVCLKTVQNKRINLFNDKNEILYNTIKKINDLPNIEIIEKNLLIQEELYKYIASNPRMNLSFYYGTIVKNNLQHNYNFHKRLCPYINDRIFDNKLAYQKFMVKAIQIFDEEIDEILINIQKSRQFWMGTGFENIANDIFIH